jgi:hypothetical protein
VLLLVEQGMSLVTSRVMWERTNGQMQQPMSANGEDLSRTVEIRGRRRTDNRSLGPPDRRC